MLRKILGRKRDVVSRDCVMRASWSGLLPRHYSGHQIYENVMLGAWSTWGGRGGDRSAYMVLVRKSEERNHLEDLGLDGRIILKYIFKNNGRA